MIVPVGLPDVALTVSPEPVPMSTMELVCAVHDAAPDNVGLNRIMYSKSSDDVLIMLDSISLTTPSSLVDCNRMPKIG